MVKKNEIIFFMKTSQLSELLRELVKEHPATIAAVTDDKPTLLLEVVPSEKLRTFLSRRSVRRLHLMLGRAPKSEDDWDAIDRAPKKNVTIELGRVDEKARTISTSTAVAPREGPALELLTALKTLIERECCKGVRVKSKTGAIKTMPYFWSPDLEGWKPEGFTFPFEKDA